MNTTWRQLVPETKKGEAFYSAVENPGSEFHENLVHDRQQEREVV